MQNITKKPYEISLWDDVLVFKVFGEDGVLLATYEDKLPDVDYGQNVTVRQYYKERKICTIGSDTMETPARAVQGKLVSNVNGSNTLTFSIYYRYFDEEIGEMVYNPFHKLLVNERKIKLRYGALGATDTKWYDLIIKNVQENSENKTFTYTCKDQFVNELSKSGFSIQLDTELENNQGTITELAAVILDGSDWKLRDGSDVLVQYKEEPLYKIQLGKEITAKTVLGSDEITIAANEYIYVFYSIIENKNSSVQFLYTSDEIFKKNDDYVIDREYPNYIIEGIEYTIGENKQWPEFTAITTVGLPNAAFTDEYRGDRIVRQIQTKYDSTIDKYINVYNDGQLYGYTESEYISPTLVQNYITNPDNFESDAGWVSAKTGGTVYGDLEINIQPDITSIDYDENTVFTSYLKFNAVNAYSVLINTGVDDNLSNIGSFAANDKYIFRIKALNSNGSYISSDYIQFIQLGRYEIVSSNYIFVPYFEVEKVEILDDNTLQYTLKNIIGAVPYSTLIKEKLGLFIDFINGEYNIENTELFLYAEDMDGKMCEPGVAPAYGVKTKYYYYEPNPEATSTEELSYVYIGYTPNIEYIPTYNQSYEKIRSITATESNRFNLIQDLCEAFECWPKFEIEHDPQTGEILLDEDYRQKKWVSFHEYIGKDNYTGFRYGTNLKSIQRTLNSDGIVSKLIVKNNANEFATNGFCSIARARENPSGENFIIDFSHYVQQGLLNYNTVINDLYLENNGYIGLYKILKGQNTYRDELIEEQAALKNDIMHFESDITTYELTYSSANEEIVSLEKQLLNQTGYTYEQFLNNKPSKNGANIKIVQWWNDNSTLGIINSIASMKTKSARSKELLEESQAFLLDAQTRDDEINKSLEEILSIKNDVLYRFYKKYSRFLQEGSWINEDYIDDNLYYLDAESTLNISAKPKVTYTINVLELSQLEEYENYIFNLGDKTYIEDTEFFGWTWIDGVQTPYHEEIVVTELTVSLDSPETNTIKVQNYKTQFEDLFQRMAATTQSVEYHTGEYTKASSIVTTQGTIDIDVLQNSFTNNSLVLQNAKDQSVIWDETGITTSSLSKPNEIVRMVSGGIFISNDGGSSWNTGITGSGINANYITSGQINTSKVNIMSGSFPSFRWDSLGLDAYHFELDEQTNQPQNFNYARFVRFDQYGLYGINGETEFKATSVEDIEAEASFALTWNGFLLRNKYSENAYVSISNTKDFVVHVDGQDRIQIGNIQQEDYKYSEPIYGIRISDTSGASVMETVDDGTLWLKNRLNIDTYSNGNKVGIGKLDTEASKDTEHGGRVIDANNNFIVYEDGFMKATGGEFTGTINATGGKIGGLEIAEWEKRGYEVVITSNIGNSMKVGSQVELTATLYKGTTPVNNNVTYQWYDQNGDIVGATSQKYQIESISFNNGFVQYGCRVELKEETNG